MAGNLISLDRFRSQRWHARMRGDRSQLDIQIFVASESSLICCTTFLFVGGGGGGGVLEKDFGG